MKRSYWEVLRETWNTPILVLAGFLIAIYGDGDLGWKALGVGIVASLVTWLVMSWFFKLSLDTWIKLTKRG